LLLFGACTVYRSLIDPYVYPSPYSLTLWMQW